MKIFKLFLMLNIAFLSQSYAQLFVNAAATGSGNGSSWNNAYTDIQNAINASVAGQEIWVQAGTYIPLRDRSGIIPADPRNATFVLKEGVKLYGGFAGNELALSQRNIEANPTLLSGDRGIAGDDTDNIYTMLLCVNLTAASRIDGFTVAGANNNRNNGNVTIAGYVVDQNDGGAGWILSSAIEIVNCKFISNKSIDEAAGLLILHGSVLDFVNCEFIENTTVNGGGAIYVNAASVSFHDCNFADNFAGAGSAAFIIGNINIGIISNCTFTNNEAKSDGGALLFYSINPLVRTLFTITNSTFDNNTCIPVGTYGGTAVIATRGGAIYADRTDLTITGCSFSNHTISFKPAGGSSGGALDFGYQTTVRIDKCHFLNNSIIPYTTGGAAFGGAISAQSDFEIRNCVFAGNHSVGTAGAISLSVSGASVNKTAVANCVFFDNNANIKGGAIWYGTSAANIPSGFTNLTFYGNTSPIGGAIVFDSNSSNNLQTIKLQNCIFESNMESHIGYFGSFDPAWLIQSNNWFQSDEQSVLRNVANPIGLDQVWGTIDDGLHVSLCSDALDTGINTALVLPGVGDFWTQEDLDITGNPRLKGTQVDLGAYESDENAQPLVITPLPEIIVDAGAAAIVINLNDYFSIATGTLNTYSVTSNDPGSGLFQAIISENLLTITFSESQTGSGNIAISAANMCGLMTSGSISVTVNPDLSSDDFAQDQKFIYPNPTDGVLFLSGIESDGLFEIVNVLGQTVQKGHLINGRIDVRNLTAGVYVLVAGETTAFRVKFIKK